MACSFPVHGIGFSAAVTSPRAVTAAEFLRELDDRYHNDPEHRARVDGQEAERRTRRDALHGAERPLATDLQAAGIPVDSARKLYKYPELGEIAYPILLKHLRLEIESLRASRGRSRRTLPEDTGRSCSGSTSPRTVAKSATAWPQR